MKNSLYQTDNKVKLPVEKQAMASANVRQVDSYKRGKDGLFIEPDLLTPDQEKIEIHNRERFQRHFNLDEFGPSYDELGRYNCGRCNQANGTKCLLVNIDKISLEQGSCEDWEKKRAGDPEVILNEKSPEAAVYGVLVKGNTYGCKVCPYSSKAKNIDSEGRDQWCGKGYFHTRANVCCGLNGAETIDSDYDDD